MALALPIDGLDVVDVPDDTTSQNRNGFKPPQATTHKSVATSAPHQFFSLFHFLPHTTEMIPPAIYIFQLVSMCVVNGGRDHWLPRGEINHAAPPATGVAPCGTKGHHAAPPATNGTILDSLKVIQ